MSDESEPEIVLESKDSIPRDADLAMDYIDDDNNASILSNTNLNVLNKVDWGITPIIACLMCVKMMEKNITSYGSMLGLQDDLKMSQSEYTWVASIFYFGYLIFDVPGNLILQKALSKTIAISVIVWAILLLCHAACQSSSTFLTCRFFLGVFECVMSPAYTLLTSQWWKREEQFMRCCIWFGFQGLGTILEAAAAYGLYIHGSRVLASWRLLYIITGIVTLVFGFIAAIHIPDFPMKAWFLNDVEKMGLLQRIRPNHQGFGNTTFKKAQLLEALTDAVTYILFIYGVTYSISSTSFSNFGTLLLKNDFGYSSRASILMGMIGGALDMTVPMSVAYVNQRFLTNRKLWICSVASSITLIGMILFNFSEDKNSRLFGYFSFYISTIVISGIISNISSNVAGHTKKITVNTIFNLGSSIGSIIGPQSFKTNDFDLAKKFLLSCFIIGTFCILILLMIYTYRNSERDRLKKDLKSSYIVPNFIEFYDLTDMENPEFRYTL